MKDDELIDDDHFICELCDRKKYIDDIAFCMPYTACKECADACEVCGATGDEECHQVELTIIDGNSLCPRCLAEHIDDWRDELLNELSGLPGVGSVSVDISTLSNSTYFLLCDEDDEPFFSIRISDHQQRPSYERRHDYEYEVCQWSRRDMTKILSDLREIANRGW